MAQEDITELGFDATPVIAALNQLDAAFATYTQALRTNIQAITQFNNVQASTGDLLDQTAARMTKLKAAAQASAEATRGLLAPQGGIRSKATLGEISKVNDAVKGLENTLLRTKVGDEGLLSVLDNLGGDFQGNLAEVQSSVIKLKGALDSLGSTNLRRTTDILKADARELTADLDSRIKLAGRLLDAQNKSKLAAERGAVGQTAAQALGQKFPTLGVDPAKAAGFNTALQRLQQTVEKSGISSDRFFQILKSGDQTFTGVEGKVKSAILNVERLGKSMTSASQSASAFQFNLQSLIKVFTFQTALHAVSALFAEFRKGIDGAVEFEKAIAQVSTITDEGSKNIDTLAASVLGLSNEFGKPNAEVAAGFYQAVSNQVGSTGETVQFLTTALEFSRAAVTSLSSSVDTLSGVQNAYNQTTAQTQRNADILFKVIDLGRVTADELGDSFGRITPLAAQLGVSLEEVGAAIAASTVQGVNFRDAQTQILNILVEAIKPTGAFKDRMKELGFETAEAGIAAKGFVGFFSAIGEGAANSEELAKLFNNIRGLRGQLSVFARDGELVTQALKEIEESAGSTRRAFEQIQFTNAVKIESEINRVRNTLEAGFGRRVLSILAELSDAFGGLTNLIIAMGAAAAAIVGGAVFVVMANQFVTLSAAIGGMLVQMGILASGTAGLGLLLPGGALVVGVVAGVALIAAALGQLALAESPTQKILNDFQQLRVESAKTANEVAENIRKMQETRRNEIETSTRNLIVAEEQRSAAVRQATEQAIQFEKAASSSLQQQLNARLSAFQKFQDSVKKLQDDAAQNSKRLDDKARDSRLSINERQFDRAIQGASPDEQSRQLQIRFNRLIEAANKALQSGNTQLAEKFLESAGGIASRFDDIARSTQLENRFLEEQQKIFAGINRLQQENLKAAKAAEKANAPILEQARQEIELVKDLLQRRDAARKQGPAGTQEVDALTKQIGDGLRKIDSLGAQFSLGKALTGDLSSELQNAIDALRRIIQAEPLEVQFDADTQTFLTRQQELLDANPLFIKLTVDDSAINRSQEIIELQKRAQRALDVDQNLQSKLIPESTTAFLQQEKLFAETQRAIQELGRRTSLTSGDPGERFANRLADRELREAADRGVKELQRLKAERDEILSAPDAISENTGKLTARAAEALAQNTEGLKELAKQFNLTEQVNALIDATKQLLNAREAVRNAAREVEAGQAAENILQAPPEERDRLLNLNRELEQATTPQGGIDAAPEDAINQHDKIIESGQRVKTTLDNIPKTTSIDVDTTDLEVAQTDVLSLGSAVSALRANGGNIPVAVDVDPNSQANIQNLTTSLDTLGTTGPAAGNNTAASLSGIGGTASTQVPGVQALTAALLELAAAQAAAAAGGEFASRGAFIQGFAHGGQARGSDTIPAMLTAGEVVVNPSASRQFFSQVMAMNAGARPQFLNQGGFVGDQFGDVQINIDNRGNGDKLDGRALFRQFKREARRGTLGR